MATSAAAATDDDADGAIRALLAQRGAARLGLGRIVALYWRSSTSHRNR
jgi:hypothetical protein